MCKFGDVQMCKFELRDCQTERPPAGRAGSGDLTKVILA